MKPKSITFITGNKNKAEHLRRFLNFPVKHKKLDLDEIQSLDLNKIVEHKVKEAYKLVKSPVLVEDVSLKYGALGNLPGPLIRWFLEALDNKGLCKLIDHYKNRSALAEVTFGYYDGKIFKVFHGEISGSIAAHPRGKKGFGWDPIFVPEGSKKTWSEMNHREFEKYSIRKIALAKFQEFLDGKAS